MQRYILKHYVMLALLALMSQSILTTILAITQNAGEDHSKELAKLSFA